MKKVHEEFRPPQVLVNKICECILSCLEGRDQELLRLRFLGKSQDEIADILSMEDKQYVSLIEQKALERFVIHIKRAEKQTDTPMQTPLSSLRLPYRAATALLAGGVKYVEQLVLYTPKELLAFHGIRNASVVSIRDALRKRNLSLS